MEHSMKTRPMISKIQIVFSLQLLVNLDFDS